TAPSAPAGALAPTAVTSRSRSSGSGPIARSEVILSQYTRSRSVRLKPDTTDPATFERRARRARREFSLGFFSAGSAVPACTVIFHTCSRNDRAGHGRGRL